MFKKFIHITLEILFPERCLGCFKWGQIICQNCLKKIPKSQEAELPENIQALWHYRHFLVRKVISQLKNRGTKPLAEISAPYFLAEINFIIPKVETKIYLIPVPATAGKDRLRGYNQAKILAQAIVKQNDLIEVKNNLVKKIKKTKDQTETKNKKERLKNLKRAFLVSEKLNSDIIYIIIDDVVTTGSTINEVKQALIKAGARKVYGLALAH